MTFDDILAQILDLLQRDNRISYRALKVRFQLDDALLEAVKDALIYAKKLAVDGVPVASEPICCARHICPITPGTPGSSAECLLSRAAEHPSSAEATASLCGELAPLVRSPPCPPLIY